MGLQRRENDPKRVPSLGISEPISHVKTVEPINAKYLDYDAAYTDSKTSDTSHKFGRSTTEVKHDEDNRGNVEAYEARSSMEHPQTKKLSGRGYAGKEYGSDPVITDPNKARQLAFNRASTEYTNKAKEGVK